MYKEYHKHNITYICCIDTFHNTTNMTTACIVTMKMVLSAFIPLAQLQAAGSVLAFSLAHPWLPPPLSPHSLLRCPTDDEGSQLLLEL